MQDRDKLEIVESGHGGFGLFCSSDWWTVRRSIKCGDNGTGALSNRLAWALTVVPAILAVSLASVFSANSAFSASLYWDPNGVTTGRGGAGTWNLTGAFWSATADGRNGPYSA